MTHSRLRLAIAAALVLVVPLAGCTALFPPAVAATSTPTGEKVDAALEPFYSQVLEWTDCDDGMQCSTATAPLNWDDPAAGSVDLAVVRQPATGDRLGSLLLNPGGPGGSGYDFVKDSVDYATDEALQERYDIVGFDPRGVGKSSPVACYEPAEMDEYLYGLPTNERGSDAWIAEQEASAAAFANACAERTGALLGEVDTASAAHDLDRCAPSSVTASTRP